MERIVERPGPLDVHRVSVTACVRVWRGRELEERVEEFATTVHGLLALRGWLLALGVKRVAMEATGVYWKRGVGGAGGPLRAAVGQRSGGETGPRSQDRHPGTPQWLCQLLEVGLVRGGFVPPSRICTLRNLTRYRKTQIFERRREANRLHKILGDIGIKLGCVASDVLGKSGRDMLDALVSGTAGPAMLPISPVGSCARRSRRSGRRWSVASGMSTR